MYDTVVLSKTTQTNRDMRDLKRLTTESDSRHSRPTYVLNGADTNCPSISSGGSFPNALPLTANVSRAHEHWRINLDHFSVFAHCSSEASVSRGRIAQQWAYYVTGGGG